MTLKRGAIVAGALALALVAGGAAIWYASRERAQEAQAERGLAVEGIEVSSLTGTQRGPYMAEITYSPDPAVDATILCNVTGARNGPQGEIATIHALAGGPTERYPVGIPALPRGDTYTIRCTSSDGPVPLSETSAPFTVGIPQVGTPPRETSGGSR